MSPLLNTGGIFVSNGIVTKSIQSRQDGSSILNIIPIKGKKTIFINDKYPENKLEDNHSPNMNLDPNQFQLKTD